MWSFRKPITLPTYLFQMLNITTFPFVSISIPLTAFYALNFSEPSPLWYYDWLTFTFYLGLQILLKLVTNPYPYTDKAADLVQEAGMLQVSLFKQDSDNVSIPISHIDGKWWF